jgi:hypothetical protein
MMSNIFSSNSVYTFFSDASKAQVGKMKKKIRATIIKIVPRLENVNPYIILREEVALDTSRRDFNLLSFVKKF